jgi:plasmid segregation protein ParM
VIDVYRDYGKVAENVIRESIAVMMGSIGDIHDVDNIILTGGGANVFFNEIQKSFPGRKIIKDVDPVISNVCGFQRVGEQWARGMK